MANRFPLVVDTDDANKIKEIPVGDTLDLANSGIANLTELSVAGSLSSATLTTSGLATLASLQVAGATTLGVTDVGTINATNINLGGEAFTGVPIQSDWTETDNTSLAFIQNKPIISNTVDSINDIGDVDTAAAINGYYLEYNGFEWKAVPNSGGDTESIQDAIFSETIAGSLSIDVNPPSGRGSLDLGKTKGDAGYGEISYTPPNALIKGQQDVISELINDSAYVNAAFLTAIDSVTGKYLKGADVIGFGRITSTVNTGSGQAELTFDETGLITEETDTLETVTARGASSSIAIEADAFNQAPTSTNTNTLKDVSIETLDILTGITGTNSTIALTNGNITTGGNIQAQDITATQNLSAGFIVGAVNISNTTGDMELTVPTGSRIDITAGRLRLGSTTGVPANPEIGEIIFDGSTFFAYVNDTDGAGTAGAVGFPSVNNPFGLQLPQVETGDEPLPAVEGMMIYNLTDDEVQVYKPTGWTSIG